MAGFEMFQGMEEAALGTPDENGIPKFEEQKLRRYLKNTKLGSPNKIMFETYESKFKTCPRYDPCPICDKCRNKASHLYVACQTCRIPMCSHTDEDRSKMIKRHNFKIIVEPYIMNYIKELDKQVTEQFRKEN